MNVKTKVTNALQDDQAVTLKTVVVDNNGRKVAATESNAVVPKGSVVEFDQNLTIEKPERWSVDAPAIIPSGDHC